MKKHSLFYILLIVVFFVACNKEPIDVTPPDDNPNPPPTTQVQFPKKEMRGVWMATVWELDWPMGKYGVQAQKDHYTTYLDLFKSMNINAVFVQIKGMGDAFYNSPYEPWSKSITGVRGQDPGYDVLKFMIDEAHARDIEFHAWMNPYRISTAQPYPELHSSIDPSWVSNYPTIQIYNPALPEVHKRLADIVKDVITKYDVDGIHFDDYFYPADVTISDDAEFAKYGSGYNNKADFRRGNVDKAIKGVHDIIAATKPEVVFSVSPASDPDYNLNKLYANVPYWCEQGWVDVIIPQLYHEIGHPTADFQSRLNWWAQYSYKATLMVGHGLYRFGDPNAGAAFQTSAELQRQIEMTRKNKKSFGNIMYSAKYILFNKVGVTDKLRSLYTHPGVIPFLGRSVAGDPVEPSNVRLEGNTLKWDTSNNVKSVVYYFTDLAKEGIVIAVTKAKTLDISQAGNYCVTTLNADNKESKPSKFVVKK